MFHVNYKGFHSVLLKLLGEKMKIYLGHATTFDYQKDLYEPLKNSELWMQYKFFLPHEFGTEPINSKDIIASCEIFVAEVSYPSTGLGIELAWASTAACKMLCLVKENTKPSSSIRMITSNIIQYVDRGSLINKLSLWLDSIKG